MGDDITEQEFIDGIDGHEARMQRQQAQAVSQPKGESRLDTCFTVPSWGVPGPDDESNENNSC